MQFIGAGPTVDLTYSDVFLVPSRSKVRSRLEVELTPHDGTPARLPLVAANMNAVTGHRLAATLARRGGLAILPQDLSLDDAVRAIRWVKNQPTLCDSPRVFAPDTTAAEALRSMPAVPGLAIVVANMGGSESTLTRDNVLGVLLTKRLESAPADARLADLIHETYDPLELSTLTAQRETFDLVHELTAQQETEALVVCDGARVVGTITPTSALRNTLYQPALDDSGALAVGAAIGISRNAAHNARELAEAGADVLVIDTAHGHQEHMIQTVEAVAGLGLGLPIVAGNVVTAEGVRDLVAAGADIVKVGVGPGAMCTTRMMTAVGRPQFSAVLDTVSVARELGAHVWADGGVKHPRDVALALAAGAASVMIGSWFAGTIEAPGELHQDEHGRLYKTSWGMASTKAVQQRFRGLSAYERARKELFSEGISESRMYLDQARPGVEDLIDMISSGVRSSFTYAGAATLQEFHVRARVGIQSAAGYEEGKAVPESW